MKSQHLKVFFVWFAHTPLSTSLMDGKISSSRLLCQHDMGIQKHNVDPELGQDSVTGALSNPFLHHKSKNVDNQLCESPHCTSKTHS